MHPYEFFLDVRLVSFGLARLNGAVNPRLGGI